jgi:hypothetical protein
VWILARRFCGWREHLSFVTPETVVRWHRQGWRLFWRWNSRSRGGSPHLTPEVQDLIATMSRDNRMWGTERIRGELLKLGIVVSNRSIRLNHQPVVCRDGVRPYPAVVAREMPVPDLVVVPGLDDDLPDSTTHWLFADEFGRRYPNVDLRVDRMIIDNVMSSPPAAQRLFSTSPSTSWTASADMSGQLLARFHGYDRMAQAVRGLERMVADANFEQVCTGEAPPWLRYVRAAKPFNRTAS